MNAARRLCSLPPTRLHLLPLLLAMAMCATACSSTDAGSIWQDPASDAEANEGATEACNPGSDATIDSSSPQDAPQDGYGTDVQQEAEPPSPDGGQEASFDAGDGAGPSDDAAAQPHPLFDMAMIRDASTAQCSFTNATLAFADGVLLQGWSVSYVSWESVGGVLKPIVIRGFAARPQGSGTARPGIVLAHGLGGYGDLSQAAGVAAKTGAFVIAYSGPGSGSDASNTSEGIPPMEGGWYRLFDTATDTRGSWFWAHAVAAMRGLTCLEGRADVDPARLGMTGYSGGGIATLIAAGVDSRVKAAVPISSSHAFSVAALSPGAWWHGLVQSAGLTLTSPEWTKTQQELIDPAATVAHASASILMVNGTADEFFPLTAHVATLDAVPHDNKRTSLIGNYDHGCYQKAGVEAESAIADRASLRMNGGQRAWFHHWFGTDADYAYLPAAPKLQIDSQGSSLSVTAVVDPGGSTLKVGLVGFWFSIDDGYTWQGVALDSAGGGVFAKQVPITLPSNAVTYVDVEYSTKALLNPGKFSLSSRPEMPAGVVLHIRDQSSCQ
ncbi:MAG: hypothetical protein HY898_31385 [Deltaproteobacteria bacterium]|nr:hypothetical protein [Deltaproteobacteria bacterium]